MFDPLHCHRTWGPTNVAEAFERSMFDTVRLREYILPGSGLYDSNALRDPIGSPNAGPGETIRAMPQRVDPSRPLAQGCTNHRNAVERFFNKLMTVPSHRHRATTSAMTTIWLPLNSPSLRISLRFNESVAWYHMCPGADASHSDVRGTPRDSVAGVVGAVPDR